MGENDKEKERTFAAIGKHHDIESETGDMVPFWIEGCSDPAYSCTVNEARLLAERKRIAAAGRIRFKEFRGFMIAVLHLSESTADQAVSSVALAQHEYNDKGWYKLYSSDLAASTGKGLFADFVKLAQWWAHRKPQDAQEREQLDELIDALAQCEFFQGDRAALLARYFEGVDVDALLRGESDEGDDEPIDEEPVAPVPAPRREKRRADVPKKIESPVEQPAAVARRGRKPKAEQTTRSFDMAGEIERLMAATGTRDPKLIMLSTERAARLLGLQPTTLRRWRHRNEGPPYTRMGDNDRCQAVYSLADILEWLEKRKYRSTSDESARRTRDLLTEDQKSGEKPSVRRRDDGKKVSRKPEKKKPWKPE
jgi:hypothetical protein